MNEQQNNSAKFAFFYMLSLVALIFMAISTGMIIFQIINKNIVDAINQFRGSYAPEQLKFAISALIISAPIFYLTTWQLFKNLYTGALAKDSGVRKWLTYFIIFVSSVVMIGWLIATINSFLDGELTSKFILKAMTAIFIAAAIFTFYLHDIKREEVVGKKDKVIRLYLYGSIIVVIAVFVSSLFFVESPTETRNRKLDNVTLEKFETISSALSTYYSDNSKLPEDLEEIKSEFSYITDQDLHDPLTKEKFEYKIIDSNTFEICATFRTNNINEENIRYSFYQDRWPHDSGHQCLKQKVREEGIKTIDRIPVPIK